MARRNAVAWYFTLAFAIAWIGVLVARFGDRYALFIAMLLGPSIASIGLTFVFEGTRGLREVTARLVRVPVGARFYAALLVAPTLLVVVLSGLSQVSPSYEPAAASGASSIGSAVTYAVVAGLGAGIFEELGWTGFATPRLLERHGAIAAGLQIGFLWALWHMPADWFGRADHGALWFVHALEWFVALAAYRVLMTWIYSHTKSLGLGMLLHASFTGSQALLWPAESSLGHEVIWYGAFALALAIAVPLILLASGRFPSIAATTEEKRRRMPGDAVVPDPMSILTHAITIAAPPDRVWPWLAQMGAERAGWYSYDRIDNGGRSSANDFMPELQSVARGDVLPALPGATDVFVVEDVQPPNDILLTVPGRNGPIMSWEHRVEDSGNGRSRLLVRARVGKAWKSMASESGTRPTGKRPVFIERVYRVLGRLPDALMMAVGGAGHRVMEARHMRGIKRRAESVLVP